VLLGELVVFAKHDGKLGDGGMRRFRRRRARH
jgi:hypothetical protein